jgi:hypothetical protein
MFNINCTFTTHLEGATTKYEQTSTCDTRLDVTARQVNVSSIYFTIQQMYDKCYNYKMALHAFLIK